MSRLLIEFLFEPLPVEAQESDAPKEFARRIESGLRQYDLLESGASTELYITRNRMAVLISGVKEYTPQRETLIRGPSTNANEKAISGFSSKFDLTNTSFYIEDNRWFARISFEAGNARLCIPEIAADAITDLPWKKTMTWEPTGFRFPRPITNYLIFFGDDTLDIDPSLLPLNSNSIYSTRDKNGYALFVKSIAAWEAEFGCLKNHTERNTEKPRKVSVPINRTRDPELAPFVAEILKAEMRADYDEEESVLTFTAENSRKNDVATFEDNLRHRLKLTAESRMADAEFYLTRDREKGLYTTRLALKAIKQHNLGDLYMKCQRMGDLSCHIALEAKNLRQVIYAQFATTDKASEMVRHFPFLEGRVSPILFRDAHPNGNLGNKPHYHTWNFDYTLPLSEPQADLLALTDNIDDLVGFYIAGKRTTGAADPYKLRRKALAIVKVLQTEPYRDVALYPLLIEAARLYRQQDIQKGEQHKPLMKDLELFILDRFIHTLPDTITHAIRKSAVANPNANGVLYQMRDNATAISNSLNTDDGKRVKAVYTRIVGLTKDAAKPLYEPATALATTITLERATATADTAMRASNDAETRIRHIEALCGTIGDYLDANRVLQGIERENRLAVLLTAQALIASVFAF